MKHWKVYLEGNRSIGVGGSKEIFVEVDSLPDISDTAPAFQQLVEFGGNKVIVRTNSILRIEEYDREEEDNRVISASELRKKYLITEKQSEKKYNDMIESMISEKCEMILGKIMRDMKELASKGHRIMYVGENGKWLFSKYYEIGKDCTDIANECKAYNVKKHLCNGDVMQMVYKKVAESLKARGYDIEEVRIEHTNETCVKVAW